MSKKSRSRRQKRHAAFKYAGQEFHLTDLHTDHRVTLRSPLRFAQIIYRGWAEQIGQTRARLIPLFRLDSSELAENGEPRLRAVQGEKLWPNGTTCPTHRICETAWLMSGASFTLDQAEAALIDRQMLIEQETLRWGLPDGKPVRIKESWGVFGEIEYV